MFGNQPAWPLANRPKGADGGAIAAIVGAVSALVEAGRNAPPKQVSAAAPTPAPAASAFGPAAQKLAQAFGPALPKGSIAEAAPLARIAATVPESAQQPPAPRPQFGPPAIVQNIKSVAQRGVAAAAAAADGLVVQWGGSVRTIRCRITFYASGEKDSPDPDSAAGRSSTGVPLVPGRHAAVDPKLFPYGSILRVEGFGDVVAIDTGSAVVKQTASLGKAPVVDLYVADADYDRYRKNFPPYANVSVIGCASDVVRMYSNRKKHACTGAGTAPSTGQAPAPPAATASPALTGPPSPGSVPEGIMPGVQYVPTVHQFGAIKPRFIIMHRTFGRWPGDVNYCKKNPKQVSYHFIVGPGGEIAQMAPITRKVYHAEAANDRAVGIGFTGDGNWDEAKQQMRPGFRPLTLGQMESGARIASWIISQLPNIVPSIPPTRGPRRLDWHGTVGHFNVPSSTGKEDTLSPTEWASMMTRLQSMSVA